MKHAYLIIAHGNWKQLEYLLKQLDFENNDIYIHIDKKVKHVPITELKKMVVKSKIEIYQEYKVYWGSFELVQVELFLLKKASKEKYDYYHLLSGMDLLIKPMEEINDFFEKNKGKEFVHFDKDNRLIEDKEIMRRVKHYHFLANYRKGFKKLKFLNKVCTFIERCSLGVQTILRIDRTKKYKNLQIKYGSQWFSITDNFCKYILSQEELVYKIFYRTKCSDELVVQTLLFNSKFKNSLYNKKFNDDVMANVRLIDLKMRGKDGSPYTWKIDDYDEIKESRCLFARKFDINIDPVIVEKICNKK